MVRVLRDPALRARLGAAGRRTVEEAYSWDVIGAGLRGAFDALRRRRLTRTMQAT